MKVWTIQSSQVHDILSREGFYQPNFYQSTYLELIPERKAVKVPFKIMAAWIKLRQLHLRLLNLPAVSVNIQNTKSGFAGGVR